MACTWQKKSEWAVGSMQFDEPIQGIAPDCALIAALSSAVFAGSRLTITDLGEYVDGIKKYKVEFFPKAGPSPCDATVKQAVYVTDRLYYNSIFCWSRSKTTNEIWVGILEKAFAAFQMQEYGTEANPIDAPGTSIWDPTGANIRWGGNPANSLSYILGRCNTQKNTAGRLIFTDPEHPELGDGIWDEIKTYCNILSNKITKPFVAWTGTSIVCGNKEFDADVCGVHSYSVLGLMDTTKYPKHIVLRNPTGVTVGGTVVTGINWGTITLRQGIWAIPITDFACRFEHYGWV